MAIVTVNLTSESYMHLSEVLGVCVQGTAPNVQINRAVQDVVDALPKVDGAPRGVPFAGQWVRAAVRGVSGPEGLAVPLG